MALIKRDDAITQIAQFLEDLTAHTSALLSVGIPTPTYTNDDDDVFIDFRVRIFDNSITYQVGDNEFDNDYRGYAASGSICLSSILHFEDFQNFVIDIVNELEELGVMWDG